MKKLPKKFQGAAVVRGLGMKSDKRDTLIDKKALDQFDATRETYLVIEDKALEDDSRWRHVGFGIVVRCFADEAAALRCAQALVTRAARRSTSRDGSPSRRSWSPRGTSCEHRA